jgi:hypothetical protein
VPRPSRPLRALDVIESTECGGPTNLGGMVLNPSHPRKPTGQLGELRKIAPRVGMRGQIHYIHQFHVAGWPERHPVTVIAEDEREVTVRDAAGREQVFDHWNVDVGFDLKIDDRWYPEGSEYALDCLEAHLAELRAEATRNNNADLIEGLVARLRQLGRGGGASRAH